MQTHSHITLSQLQRLVKEALHERFALPVWVSAEISEIKVNYSGHCYLELVEKGGDNGVPLAQSRAVIWRTAYPRIAGYFEAETGQRLAAGIKILAKVAVNYHELYGFSLQITDIDPTYTLGDMERQRQMTIAQLQKEGVWDMNREAPMPVVVQRVAVVSSANAAGYQDFRKELTKSPYRFEVTLFDAFMLVTLRYDQSAVFPADSTFSGYIARQVKWGDDEPAARIVLRYTVTPEGDTVVAQELESTDSRLKRRVLKAVAEAPRWTPARKNGTPVESEGILHIQLPEGKLMPRQVELVWR